MGDIVHVRVKSLKYSVFITQFNFRVGISGNMFSDNRCDGATWKMNSETEGTGATHLPWPSDGWRNSCFHLCPVIWNVCTLNRGLGNKYFPKWAVYLHGASLTAWALYCLMTWVIHFRCNIKCPCAFCTPLIHGVSDWMGDNKWNDTRINWHYLNSKVVFFFFCHFQLRFSLEQRTWRTGAAKTAAR